LTSASAGGLYSFCRRTVETPFAVGRSRGKAHHTRATRHEPDEGTQCPWTRDTNIRRPPSGQPGCVKTLERASGGGGRRSRVCKAPSQCLLAGLDLCSRSTRTSLDWRGAKDRRESNRSAFDPNFPMLAAGARSFGPSGSPHQVNQSLAFYYIYNFQLC
jgi:hypothetical protein